MEIRQLRYAVLLAEQRHFGRAAQRAYITQSAFSQQIAQLERELDIRLFDRQHSGVEITAAGERFVEQAHNLLAGISTLENDIRSMALGHSGVLRIGIFGVGAGELTPMVVASYRRALPDVRLEFHELSMTSQVDELMSGQVDVALLHPLLDETDIELTSLLEEPRFAALPSVHPLAEADSLSVSDLADEPFVTARSGTPAAWRSFWTCGEPEASAHFPRAEMSSIGEGLAAVAFLNVVDTVPASSTRYHRHPGVRFVPLIDASYSAVAVARKRKDTRPGVEAFCALADQIADRHVAMVPLAVRPGQPHGPVVSSF